MSFGGTLGHLPNEARNNERYGETQLVHSQEEGTSSMHVYSDYQDPHRAGGAHDFL